jgi:hypothetical protein
LVGRKQEAETGSWFTGLEAGMEARGWILEAGKYGLLPWSLSSI